ncbi:hypothetical protein JTE90_012732 [Oedothorax gibbosus]|uniref:Uncharacterized protein n=1 Tax=Oedothorax gibbosus TaxID=931172 RepID=A0AAV6VZY3_9ARAC|nr:hypothetical protein JTE90_012732 [Oedothorax gibbosus]
MDLILLPLAPLIVIPTPCSEDLHIQQKYPLSLDDGIAPLILIPSPCSEDLHIQQKYPLSLDEGIGHQKNRPLSSSPLHVAKISTFSRSILYHWMEASVTKLHINPFLLFGLETGTALWMAVVPHVCVGWRMLSVGFSVSNV